MKHALAAALVLLSTLFAFEAASGRDGVLLSPDDYGYLAAQGIERNDRILEKMSPKELRHLHNLIHDIRTENDPQARAKAVSDALKEFGRNQQWEKDNPGQLWDANKQLAWPKFPPL